PLTPKEVSELPTSLQPLVLTTKYVGTGNQPPFGGAGAGQQFETTGLAKVLLAQLSGASDPVIQQLRADERNQMLAENDLPTATDTGGAIDRVVDYYSGNAKVEGYVDPQGVGTRIHDKVLTDAPKPGVGPPVQSNAQPSTSEAFSFSFQ